MTDDRRWLMLGIAFLVVVAAYILMTSPATPPTTSAKNSTELEALLIKNMRFGEGVPNYQQTYTESVNGFTTTYILTRNDVNRSAEIHTPLSYKKVYLLENGSVLCIKYPSYRSETCSEIDSQNSREMSYIQSVSSRFLNDVIMERNVDDAKYMMQKGYINFLPVSGTSDPKGCTIVSYTLDVSNMTISEASRFGVGPDSPKVFSFTFCIAPDGSTTYRKFGFNLGATAQLQEYENLGYKTSGLPQIIAPDNLTGGSWMTLEEEKSDQQLFAGCFITSTDKDKCVADFAATNKRADLCVLAGSRKDRCIVSIVPVTREEGLCGMVSDPSFKDDCYMELGGAYKNLSYCDLVMNVTKKSYCVEISTPARPEPAPSTVQPASGNESTTQNTTIPATTSPTTATNVTGNTTAPPTTSIPVTGNRSALPQPS